MRILKKLKMKLNSKGMTLIEVLISMTIFTVVAILALSILSISTRTNQAIIENYKNRTNNFENVFYIMQDVQSANKVDITDSGKTMTVTYNDGKKDSVYKIIDGQLNYNGSMLFLVDQDTSLFTKEDTRLIGIEIHTRAMDTLDAQRESVLTTKIFVRGE